jgi:hypothetical protein
MLGVESLDLVVFATSFGSATACSRAGWSPEQKTSAPAMKAVRLYLEDRCALVPRYFGRSGRSKDGTLQAGQRRW